MASRIDAEHVVTRVQALENRMDQLEKTLQIILARIGTSTPSLRPTVTQAQELSPSRITSNVLKNGDYEYRPLDTSRNEFRVLALENSPKDEDPISCDLIHLSLDDNGMKSLAQDPSFTSRRMSRMISQFGALSYTWGSLDLQSSIILGGHLFKVTTNLEAALRQMRKNRRPAGRIVNSPIQSYWWIDALCINQKDNVERGQQVSCMTRIYKKAAAVHVWLGEERDDSAIAMDVIRQLGDIIQRAPGEPKFWYPNISNAQKELHRRALNAFFRRPWWERVWVRQEVALPRAGTFYCGDATVPFYKMYTASDVMNRLRERLGLNRTLHGEASQESALSADFEKSFSSDTPHPVLIFAVQQECSSGQKFISFKDALFNARFCKATDPRDKVFSVLGLTDPEVCGIAADYSLSLVATYKAALHSLITATKSVDVLSACQNPERLHGFPSWVPNLVDEWKARPFKLKSHHSVASYKEADCVFTEGSDVLHLKGEFFDTVETLSDCSPQRNDTVEQLDALYLEWKSIVAQLLPRPDSDPYSGFMPEDRHYVRTSLLGICEDRSWIYFLSIGEDEGRQLRYSEDNKLLDDDAPALDDIQNIRMARSLLLPDDLKVVTSKYLPVHTYLRKYGVGRRLCVSAKGVIGLVPQDTQIGDSIVVFHGGNFPYIIRKCGEQYVLVGEACKFPSCFVLSVTATLQAVRF